MQLYLLTSAPFNFSTPTSHPARDVCRAYRHHHYRLSKPSIRHRQIDRSTSNSRMSPFPPSNRSFWCCNDQNPSRRANTNTPWATPALVGLVPVPLCTTNQRSSIGGLPGVPESPVAP
ncbi:hypothetical protein LZ30DRAFT_197361 [Colletotrichum cereale]|nr:hypothetical protein LZ30DRAFT_197361 [Colletotrichum cereale]